ncbi:MAG: hypothetical protein KDA53_14735 [Hyphomonas sp.]|nr:hypothetical protein [Hyphomonas sp.]
MRKGTLLTNNWLLCGVAITILVAIAVVSSLQGHMAITMGDLQLALTPHEEGGLRLAVVRAKEVSDLLSL